MGILTLVLYVKRLSRNNQQNYKQYDHQKLYCDFCDKYFKHLSNKKDHQKYISIVETVTRTSSLKLTLKSIIKEFIIIIIRKYIKLNLKVKA